MSLTFFTDALDLLTESLPHWWALDDTTSEVAILAGVVAELMDELAAELETVHADQSLATATQAGLQAEWALIYGAGQEQLPPTIDALRAYLQARAAEDGSTDRLRDTLLALLDTAANEYGPLEFPADGSGLAFPPDGSGLGPFGSVDPAATTPVQFPVSGAGLRFPIDGTGLGPLATDPDDERIKIVVDPDGEFFTVYVRETLTFDRAAFARAVGRYRPASMTSPVITEVPDPSIY